MYTQLHTQIQTSTTALPARTRGNVRGPEPYSAIYNEKASKEDFKFKNI